MKQVTFLSIALAAAVAGAAERKLYVADFRDKMEGAWIGQCVGVQYGAPTEFQKTCELWSFDELPVWKPDMFNGALGNDDLYVELTFVRSLEQYGLDVSIRQAGIDFANSTYPLWCANFNGRNCLRKGIAPPASSHPKYHASPDDIDYQIEADFSGIISPGLPNRAVKLGEQFGRIMNYGDGLYAGQFIGAMYAEAYFRGSRWWNEREEIVKEALKSIPAESKYAQMVRDVLSWYNGGYRAQSAWHKAWEKAVEKYGRKDSPMLGKVSSHGIDVKINGAFLLIGYLWGEGDAALALRDAEPVLLQELEEGHLHIEVVLVERTVEELLLPGPELVVGDDLVAEPELRGPAPGDAGDLPEPAGLHPVAVFIHGNAPLGGRGHPGHRHRQRRTQYPLHAVLHIWSPVEYDEIIP